MSSHHQELENRIRERAYALWQADGMPEGRAEEYWERARRLITAEDDSNRPEMTDTPPL
jgi:Protein of unknown function (DUF2934)